MQGSQKMCVHCSCTSASSGSALANSTWQTLHSVGVANMIQEGYELRVGAQGAAIRCSVLPRPRDPCCTVGGWREMPGMPAEPRICRSQNAEEVAASRVPRPSADSFDQSRLIEEHTTVVQNQSAPRKVVQRSAALASRLLGERLEQSISSISQSHSSTRSCRILRRVLYGPRRAKRLEPFGRVGFLHAAGTVRRVGS